MILVPTSDYIEPLRLVVSGEADAAALNLEAGCMLVERFFHGQITMPKMHFLKLPMALGVPKRSVEKSFILYRINEAIKSAHGTNILDDE